MRPRSYLGPGSGGPGSTEGEHMTSTLTAPERTGRLAQSASAGAGAAGAPIGAIGSPEPIVGTILPAGDEACEYEYSYDDLFSERLRAAGKPVTHLQRSEERRVGKECRCRGWESEVERESM